MRYKNTEKGVFEKKIRNRKRKLISNDLNNIRWKRIKVRENKRDLVKLHRYLFYI